MYDLDSPSKTRGCVHVLAAIGVLALVLYAASYFGFTLPTSQAGSSTSAREVRYQIRFDDGRSNYTDQSCADFAVTYAVPNGTSQKDVSACIGLTDVARFRASPGGTAYLSIQNTAPQNSLAKFSCIISVDGRIVAEVRSVGWPNIASCSALLP